MAFVETSSTPSQWRVLLLCEPADHLPVGASFCPSAGLGRGVERRTGVSGPGLHGPGLEVPYNINTRGMINFISLIGPLQVALHVVQNRRAGEQTSHRYKTNKRQT